MTRAAYLVVVAELLPQLQVPLGVYAHAGNTLDKEHLGDAVWVAAVVDVTRQPTPHGRIRHPVLIDPAGSQGRCTSRHAGRQAETISFAEGLNDVSTTMQTAQ